MKLSTSKLLGIGIIVLVASLVLQYIIVPAQRDVIDNLYMGVKNHPWRRELHYIHAWDRELTEYEKSELAGSLGSGRDMAPMVLDHLLHHADEPGIADAIQKIFEERRNVIDWRIEAEFALYRIGDDPDKHINWLLDFISSGKFNEEDSERIQSLLDFGSYLTSWHSKAVTTISRSLDPSLDSALIDRIVEVEESGPMYRYSGGMLSANLVNEGKYAGSYARYHDGLDDTWNLTCRVDMPGDGPTEKMENYVRLNQRGFFVYRIVLYTGWGIILASALWILVIKLKRKPELKN